MKSLELQHIVKQYPGEKGPSLVLQDINLIVRPGEFLCLIGPAGSGTSTLLRIIAGLVEPTSGHVVNRPQPVGMVFQQDGLMPWLTVSENIAYGLQMAGEHPKAVHRVVSEQAELLNLHDLQNHYPKDLSGAEKQRVALARALAVNPDAILFNDAFSGLDDVSAGELRTGLLGIWQQTGKTVIMVTHSPEEAVQLAGRIAVLSPRPGTIIKSITNKLPHPRQVRSDEFYKQADTLRALIQG